MKRGIKQYNQSQSIFDTFFNFGRNAAHFISNPFRYLAPSESRELADPRLANNEELNMESFWVRIIGQLSNLQDFRNLQLTCNQFYNLINHSISSPLIFSNLARNVGMPSDFGNPAHDIKTRLIQFNDKYPTELMEALGDLNIRDVPIFEMGSYNKYENIFFGEYMIHPEELKGNKVVRGFIKGEPFVTFCLRNEAGDLESRTYFKMTNNDNWLGVVMKKYADIQLIGHNPIIADFNQLKTLIEGGDVNGFRLTDQRPAIAIVP